MLVRQLLLSLLKKFCFDCWRQKTMTASIDAFFDVKWRHRPKIDGVNDDVNWRMWTNVEKKNSWRFVTSIDARKNFFLTFLVTSFDVNDFSWRFLTSIDVFGLNLTASKERLLTFFDKNWRFLTSLTSKHYTSIF